MTRVTTKLLLSQSVWIAQKILNGMFLTDYITGEEYDEISASLKRYATEELLKEQEWYA